jgi:structure-specific endonuclease subunit SLX1
LEVRFFSEDVYRVWQTWCDRVDGRVPGHIKIRLDLREGQAEAPAAAIEPSSKQWKLDLVGKGGVEGVDATYASLQPVLEKGQFVFDPDEQLDCDVCKRRLALDQDLGVICPHAECRCVSHVDCLAGHFRAEAKSESLIPIGGKCPSCQKEVLWISLMKELTLRLRGAKEVQKILKKAKATSIFDIGKEDELSDEEDALAANDISDETLRDSDDDLMSVASVGSESSGMTATSVCQGGRWDIVIKDSDDETEIL